MPNFKSDLAQEEILSTYLDTIYAKKKIEFKRVPDLNKQLQGIDVIMTVNGQSYLIDEKAQLHYLNSDLPTFTFELSYLKNSIFKEGWLFDTSKRTHYYFLITGIFLKKGINKLSSYNDIDKIKITSVNRTKLITHLKSINLSKEKLLYYDFDCRTNKTYGKNNIAELNPHKEGLIYFTEQLEEEPVNLQLRLSYLIKIGVAKRFHY
ncbi:hypothetical protein HNV10_06080 [Winogradskyella litoriviva]|uniref:NERD domain-containing protein n=1 Tax=Winogradskyella litoriviva TaxID=1220182 RepID=A0ABX2E2S4_9FLAO|nr:hypothetical protein [Winogradskyella litoriviva]NRD22799.1 hypothetical protein [Winogradskyella litoriviva]